MAPQKPTKKSPTKPADKPGSAIAELLETLDLEQLEHNLYRGRSPQDGWQRVFGGQVLGQALTAALTDRELAESLSTRARQLVETRFSPNKRVQFLCALYRNLLNQSM